MSAIQFVEVVKFRFGAPVVASDGPAGSVAHLIVDPGTRTISHVGVKLTRFGDALTVPIARVEDASAQQLRLTIARAEVSRQAEMIPAGAVRLSDATLVTSNGKRLGRLVQVSADMRTKGLLRLVVDRGWGGGEALAPVSALASIEGKRIDLHLSDQETLTAYRPDEELLREANEALYDYARLRVDLRGIDVRVVDGEIWLGGHISSDLNRRVAEDQLKGLAGLAAVHNTLMADTDVAAAVAAALAQDPRTRGQHIGVYPDLGVVHLRGVVESAAAREAAGQVAAAVPGVSQAINELAVQPGAEVVPVLASVTSQSEQVPGGG
jgi:osmotically-inducible protein OsmY/sporulation protein YlmC with PRC-barrel domain